MTKLFVIFCIMCFALPCCAAVKRDKYGRKVGSYEKQSNGYVVKKDKYGRKTGSFKKNNDGSITEYDRYGRKIGSWKND